MPTFKTEVLHLVTVTNDAFRCLGHAHQLYQWQVTYNEAEKQ